MDILEEIYGTLSLTMPEPGLYPTLQDLWKEDGEFELLMREVDPTAVRMMTSLIMPTLRAEDYKAKPFDPRPGEELVLLRDGRVKKRALVLAEFIKKRPKKKWLYK